MNESKFIEECAKRNVTSPSDICTAAEERVKEIDRIIHEAEKMRPERTIMMNIMKMFGHEPAKSTRKIIPIISEDTTQDELDPKAIELVIKVCKLLDEKPYGPRDLMMTLGISPQNDFEIYSVVKWLCANGIASRQKDASLSKGPNWDSRPT